MPIVEDILAYKDVGIAGLALIIIYYFSKLIAEKAFDQVIEANKNLSIMQKSFEEFMQKAYKDNPETMAKFSSILSDHAKSLNDHVKSKDEAINMLKEQQQGVLRDRDRR